MLDKTDITLVRTGIHVPPLKACILGGIFAILYDDKLTRFKANENFYDYFVDFEAPLHNGYSVSVRQLTRHASYVEVARNYGEGHICVTADFLNELVLKRFFPERPGQDLLPEGERRSIFFIKDRIGIPRIVRVHWEDGMCVLGVYPMSDRFHFRRGTHLFLPA